MDSKVFVGTWQLKSWVTRLKDGAEKLPYGDDPVGFLNYTEGGYMFAVLMMRDREPIRITLDELGKAKFVLLRPKYVKALFGYLKAAFSFIGYAGTYEVERDRVIHRVKASFIPNWTGTELVRYFQFSGNRLTLTTPETDGTINILVWERISAS